jgi:TPR repeat protein
VEGNDAIAMNNLADSYRGGSGGLPQDYGKAMELYHQAGELGYAVSYHKIAYSYHNGHGAERDFKKAKHYRERAAIGGDVQARYILGCEEALGGNMNRAMKHPMISAGAEHDESLTQIRQCYMARHATKEDFEKALRAHKEAKDEMKSDQRDAAASAFAARAAARGQNN